MKLYRGRLSFSALVPVRWQIAMLLLAIGALAPVRADDAVRLTSLINEYRASSQTCHERQVGPLSPLSADPALEDLGQQPAELKKTTYRGLKTIALSGAQTAKAAMDALRLRYCDLLLNDAFTAVGVSKEGNIWNIRLAEPVVSPQMGDWESAGKQALKLVNSARAKPRQCGERRFSSAAPLSWNSRLASAALLHSKAMAAQDHLSHSGRDGSTVGDRARQSGYRWRRIGENIAAGQGSAREVVAGWLSSPGHCANLMSPDFSDIGIAYATNPRAEPVIFWTQVFGSPQRSGQ